MRKSEIAELRSKSKEELLKVLSDKRKELKKLIVELGSRKVKNVAKPGEIKRDIARILTLINKKE